jgi:hypothetical protein
MSAPAYRQCHFYTCSEVAQAYIAGARDCRENGGNPTDALITRAADAYVKSVHPLDVPALASELADA